MLLRSNAAAVTLANGLQDLGVHIEFVDLGDPAARLFMRRGNPVLELDMLCSDDELCRVLTEALAALAFGEHAAPSAHPVRPRLRLVS